MAWDPLQSERELREAVDALDPPRVADLCGQLISHVRATDAPYELTSARTILRLLRDAPPLPAAPAGGGRVHTVRTSTIRRSASATRRRCSSRTAWWRRWPSSTAWWRTLRVRTTNRPWHGDCWGARTSRCTWLLGRGRANADGSSSSARSRSTATSTGNRRGAGTGSTPWPCSCARTRTASIYRGWPTPRPRRGRWLGRYSTRSSVSGTPPPRGTAESPWRRASPSTNPTRRCVV